METFDFNTKPNKSADVAELDFLSQYKTLEVDQEPASFEAPKSSEPEQPVEYYKRGPKKGQPKPPKKNVVSYNMDATDEISGDIIDGAMLLMLIDMLIPLCIVGANNFFSKQKMKLADLQLEPDQLKRLEKLTDRVVAYLKLRANPLTILVIALLCMYAVKFVVAKGTAK